MSTSPSPSDPGTILITGPTGGLGHAATLAMANRPAARRPDLILVGRPSAGLTEVTEAARAAGANAHAVGCDLGRLPEVRAAASQVRDLLGSNTVRPLRGLVANAGVSVLDTRTASGDGYELTFAVNYLAHAQLIGDLLGSLCAPARIVLLGSNTYYVNLPRRILGVPAAQWRDPVELARPAAAGVSPSMRTGGVAYSNSKLAILYYSHELQRHVRAGIDVIVFEPGFMPGTGLGREASPALQRIARAVGRLPGVSKPETSGPALASIALDDRWSHLRDGAFVVVDSERDVQPFAIDRQRESRLWDATAELLKASE
ncbi:SDR family NAD(P)-dependent oxidoreductase [Nocardia alni]|uniref:SDR family NAD(P)-dependent oxidoreductase n=1 Tax=Nocardia alni TaxID=2815723 RepID=UPI001C239C4D|nr:SDR family NAD(P)-dependent oxidoreductase [Nocardia alni]